MIRAVLFDADGVIQKASDRFYPDLTGLVENDGDRFAAEVFSAEGPCATGEGDFRQVLIEVLARWEVDLSVDEVLQIWYQIDLVDNLFELLNQIQQQDIKVALATNQQAYRMTYMGSELGYDHHFDASFYSCSVGFKKPQLEFYQHAIDRLELPAEQCLFLDDKLENVIAAREVGLQAEQFEFSTVQAGAEELRIVLEKYL